MSVDLSKVQFTSLANSYKNDGVLYTGTLVFPASIAAGSFATVTTTIPVGSLPQFSNLYGFFQESLDMQQQIAVGSGYNTAQWYRGTIDTKVGVQVTAPAPQAGVIPAVIYPVINSTNVQVVGLINNPYNVTITLAALSVPWAFVWYSLTN